MHRRILPALSVLLIFLLRNAANNLSQIAKLLESKVDFPRAIAYSCGEFISVLLDGHHKAAAAALCGKEVPCLTIIPCSGISYNRVSPQKVEMDKVHFGSIELELSNFTKSQINKLSDEWNNPKKQKSEPVKLEEYQLMKRCWEDCYAKSFSQYPNVLELAEGIALDIPEISDDFIESCFGLLDNEAMRKLDYAMLYLSRKDVGRAKTLALRFGHTVQDKKLLVTAFKVLSGIKNDPEIEQFFVDHLVTDQDKHSLLKQIADSYWDE